MKLKAVFTCVACLTALAGSAISHAQSYPARPIRIVVPFPPGGGTDIVARAIGNQLSNRVGQPVIVENKPGASTIIGAEAVAKAPADGYTLLLSGSSTYSVLPALKAKLPYDPLKDFSLLAIVAKTPLVMVASPGARIRNFGEFIETAKAKPLGYTYSTFGPGSAPHLAGEILSQEAQLQMLAVPYKGSGQAVAALLSGEINVGIESVPAVAPHIRAGKLVPLAVLGDQRSSMVPEVPTVAELKLPKAAFDAWFGLAAPAGTPQPVLKKLVAEIGAIMAMAEIKDALKVHGLEVASIGPDQFRTKIESEMSLYQAVARRAKIELE